MTPEEQAVLDYVRNTGGTWIGPFAELRKALIASEQPPAPVWPDLPTDDVGWQSTSGAISRGRCPSAIPGPWRELEVTYRVKGEPLRDDMASARADRARIADLEAQVTTYRNAQISTEQGYNERGARIAGLEQNCEAWANDYEQQRRRIVELEARLALHAVPKIGSGSITIPDKGYTLHNATDAPAPVTHERWGVWFIASDYMQSYDNDAVARGVVANGSSRKLVRIVATEVES